MKLRYRGNVLDTETGALTKAPEEAGMMPADKKVMCPTCKGAGKLTRVVNGKDVALACPTCKGSGTAAYAIKVTQ